MLDTVLSLGFRVSAAATAAFLCFGAPIILWTVANEANRLLERAYFGSGHALAVAVFAVSLNGLLGFWVEPFALRRGLGLGVMGLLAVGLFVVMFVVSRAASGGVPWWLLGVGLVSGALTAIYFAATEIASGALRFLACATTGLMVVFLAWLPLKGRP